jgi:asparagine synthase (glutamine-hydrolysing)
MDRAVQRQLVSDVPLGVYLSGGLDSSVILDCMSRVRSNIDTFSVGFDVTAGENEKFNADFLLARRTAAHYGTNHHELMLGTKDLVPLFESAIHHLDEPVGNATILPQLALSRDAKKSVSVVLGGDGGDELFGGYERYRTNMRMNAYGYVPSAVRSLLNTWPALGKLNTPAGAARYALFHFIKDPVLQRIAPSLVTGALQEEAAEKLASYGPLASGDAFMRLDREWWLVDESLLRTDKMTMAAGVESRVPFLDNEMVALSDRIAINEKVTNTTTKKILRDAFAQRLPAYLLNQPKRGWFSPGAKWLREPEFEVYAREVLSSGYAPATRDLFDWNAVQKVLTDHIEGRGYNMHIIWTLLSLQVWARTFRLTV